MHHSDIDLDPALQIAMLESNYSPSHATERGGRTTVIPAVQRLVMRNNNA